MVPALDKYNLSIVEWLEEVFGEYPRGDYMSGERSYEEEDDHWTDIARSLDAKQLKELDERIELLRNISYKLREFQQKTDSNYYTKNERHNYVERRVKEGIGRWKAKEEALKGQLVPPRYDFCITPLHRQPFER